MIDDILFLLSKAPSSHIDIFVVHKIIALLGQPSHIVADKLKEILDNDPKASIFAIDAMNKVLKMAIANKKEVIKA